MYTGYYATSEIVHGSSNQALFSSKDKSKKSKCRLLQFLFSALKVGACSANFIPILLKYFLNYQLQFLTTKRISFTKKSSKEN